VTVVPERSHQYSCPSCGAALEFAPGTAGMVCPYCAAKLDIAPSAEGSQKLDYAAYANAPHAPVVSLPPFQLSCKNCGSGQTTTAIAGRCGSCKGALITTDDLGGELKAPDGVVPFVVDKQRATTEFLAWTKSRWFAPNAMKKVGTTDRMNGAYLPHWGFDDKTTTDYTGQRGEHYYTTETYTTEENGQTVTRTRQVQHTAWYPASGRVSRDFVDVVATAITDPDEDTLRELGPWSVGDATGYQPEYLAGFDTPRYDIDASGGWASAKQEMAQVIEDDCRSDIGGDEQRVGSMQTYDQDVLFRLLLVPLWLATYLFAGKTYQVYVNANTGKVIGDRPYSWIKITSAVLAAAIAIAIGIFLYKTNQRG
jgi:hypothetical protein